MGIDPISIGVMAAGTLIQGAGAIAGGDAQAKEQRARQRMSDLEAQNQTLQQVRQARIKRGQILQAGANQGVGNSSAVTGGAEGVTATGNQNIGYISSQQNINQSIFQAQQQQTNAAGLTNLGAGITNIGGTVFGNSEYIQKKVDNIFG